VHFGVDASPVSDVLLQYVEVLQQLVDVSLLYLLVGHSVIDFLVKVTLQVIFLAQHEVPVHATGVLEQLLVGQEQGDVVVVPLTVQLPETQLPRQVFDELQVFVVFKLD